MAAAFVAVSRRFLQLLLPLLLPAADAAIAAAGRRPLPRLPFPLSSLGGATPAAARILACSGFKGSTTEYVDLLFLCCWMVKYNAHNNG